MNTENNQQEISQQKDIPAPVIDKKVINEATQRLLEYKKGKTSLDERIVDNEQFFKLRHWENKKKDGSDDVKPTAWLWNVILSKHADLMDGYPEANIRPKEKGDEKEATMLSSIIPVIFEANGFHKTYSKCSWYKLIKGTAAYGIFWDPQKQQGKGDISVEKVDILNLFWEPGITNIQQSKEVFHTVLIDKEKLEAIYPQYKGKFSGSAINVKEYTYDDTVDTSNKALVIDWYYKKYQNGKTVLHYCKYVDDIVLYATENQTQVPMKPVIDELTGQALIDDYTGEPIMQQCGQSIAQRGWYDHGEFPFVLDPLFSVEGSPCGYSYVDICKPTQLDIDVLNHSVVRNAMLGARPRFFIRGDGSVNEKEFADYSKDFVHVEGASLGDDSIKLIQTPELSSNIINVLNNKIEEMKETSGNRDVNNGSSSSGVTAASAIAALQESAGKTSRDNLANTYEAFKEITYQVIELIRQFYDVQRQFRITGENGQYQFVDYTNKGIKPQYQGQQFGIDMGYRVPQFDIEVNAQKATAYSKMSQNELALQFYSSGMFNPQVADQALACLEMMDFSHKEDVIDKVQRNQTLLMQVQQLLSISISLASKYEPQTAQQIAMSFAQIGGAQMYQQASQMNTDIKEQNADGTVKQNEHSLVSKARERTQNSTQVE
ncbi:MAG: hypothetical protein ACI4W6_07775 [Acutalibacteraceae bacterium]